MTVVTVKATSGLRRLDGGLLASQTRPNVVCATVCGTFDLALFGTRAPVAAEDGRGLSDASGLSLIERPRVLRGFKV